jgi:glycosyltransferase involved in cell wall biosynthesis
MPQIYRAADVFCLPSEMEPYGLVYLEAMGAGLPVVAVYSGGTPELVEHGRTGLLAYPKDPVALACHLTRLLCDPVLARDFGRAGRQRVKSDFDSRAIAQRWVNLLADVA